MHSSPLSPVQARLIFVAEALAQAGHTVSVFCAQSGDGEVFKQVNYQPVRHLARYARQQTIDAFVVVDDESALKLGIKARFTLAWVHREFAELWHEAPDQCAELANLLQQRADKVLVMSQWQSHCLHKHLGLTESHLQVLPTDVLPTIASLPPVTSQSEVIELAYSAAPDNGLEPVLNFFHQLVHRTRQPLALHIYANPQAYALSQEHTARLAEIYTRPEIAQSEQIHLHTALSIPERIQALARHDLWLYPFVEAQPFAFLPSFWLAGESNCLDLHCAQAAGLPLLVRDHGGLSEDFPAADRAQSVLDSLDEEAWLRQCQLWIAHPEWRSQHGQSQRAYAASQYTAERVARDWTAFLTQCVSTRNSQAVTKSVFKTPVISVVIPTYNRARNLHYCLDALTRQTHDAFEVIVCDDGSQDETRAVVSRFQECLNLRYRWQEDQGFRAAEARNLGIRLARGKYIVFLDSDVVTPPDFLLLHQQALEAHPNAAVNAYVYRMQAEDDTDLGQPPAEYIPKHLDILKPDSRDRYQLFERGGPIEETYFLDSNAMSIRRKDLEKIGFFDGDFVGWGHEDTELGYRLAQYGMTLVLIKEKAMSYHLYHYVSGHKDQEKQVNWLRLTKKYGITEWYEPLWELKVSTEINVKGLDAKHSLSARWLLKTGTVYPVVQPPLTLHVQDGVLTQIEPFSPSTFLNVHKSEK